MHGGQIGGGRALNIVPNLCTLDFEVRNLPGDDLEQILAQMQEGAEMIVREAKKLSSVAAIEIETLNVYPGLDTHPSVEAVRFLKNFAAPDTATSKVSFGTEGGLFRQRLDVPVVVCGLLGGAHAVQAHASSARLYVAAYLAPSGGMVQQYDLHSGSPPRRWGNAHRARASSASPVPRWAP